MGQTGLVQWSARHCLFQLIVLNSPWTTLRTYCVSSVDLPMQNSYSHTCNGNMFPWHGIYHVWVKPINFYIFNMKQNIVQSTNGWCQHRIFTSQMSIVSQSPQPSKIRMLKNAQRSIMSRPFVNNAVLWLNVKAIANYNSQVTSFPDPHIPPRWKLDLLDAASSSSSNPCQ